MSDVTRSVFRLDGALKGAEWVEEYPFLDFSGNPLFYKIRFRLPSGEKTFRYCWRPSGDSFWRREKPRITRGAPFNADELVMNSPDIRRAIHERRSVWWCEGEKDARNVAAVGKIATTGHAGAGKVTPGQCQKLAGVRSVYVVMDNDVAGWYDGWQRWSGLQEFAGLEPQQIHYRLPRVGKDVTEHLEAGLKLKDLRRPPAKWVAKKSLQYNEGAARRLGY